MAIRNTVSIEFTVSGPGMAQLDQIAARLRGLGGASGGVGTASSAIARLGQVSTTSAAGVNRAAGAVKSLGAATGQAAGAMQRIGEIMLGSFGGNVLAGIFTSAAAAAASFARESVGAALSAEQALVVLKTQSRLTGTDLAANIELAKKLAKEFRISDTAGVGIVGAGTKFTSSAGKPAETLNFLRAVADLSAAAGRPLSDLQETLRQLAAGGAVQESALDKIGGGVNPSQIFEAFGKSVGVAADKLTEAQRSLAIYNFLMERASKVQGVAQESLTTTTGRISALSAAYDNIQTKLGKLIIDTPIFQRGLEGLEAVAVRLGNPETLAGFERMSKIFETIARGAVIAGSSIVAFGDIMSTVWTVALTKAQRFVERLVLFYQKLGNDLVLAMTDAFDAIPGPVKLLFGLPSVDTGAVRAQAVTSNAQISNQQRTLTELNRQLDANASSDIQRALSSVAGAVAAFDRGGTAGAAAAANAGAPTPAQISNLAGATGGAAGAFLADFKRVPILVATENGLTSTMGFQRVAREQTAASADLAKKTAALTSIMEEVQKNPAFARVEFVAGPDTLIKSVVSTGGAVL